MLTGAVSPWPSKLECDSHGFTWKNLDCSASSSSEEVSVYLAEESCEPLPLRRQLGTKPPPVREQGKKRTSAPHRINVASK